MPLSLIYRLVKASKLTPLEMDNNLRQIQDAVNAFYAQLAASLNPNGTLKDNTVNTNAIVDRAVTLRKLAFLSSFWAADTGTANVIVIEFTPALPDYVAGLVFWVKAAVSNTGATTLQCVPKGHLPVKKISSTGLVDLAAGDIIALGEYCFVCDGTQFVLINPTAASVVAPVSSGPVFPPISSGIYTGGVKGWTTIDATALGVPAGAKAIILQGRGWWDTDHDGKITTQIRPDPSGANLILNEVGGTDSVTVTTQGIFPLSAGHTFQYQVSVTTGVDPETSDVSIVLIGWIL